MPPAQLEKKVKDYLRDSHALEDHWQQPLSVEQLQAEMERMAQQTKQPEVLRELFEALGNDPFVVAECLARQVLTERSIADVSVQDKTRHFQSGRAKRLRTMSAATSLGDAAYSLPKISEADTPCTNNTWTATSTINQAPIGREWHTAVWTGSEMIVWGGDVNGGFLNSGGRYNPGTDSWTATSTANAPAARAYHTAVWTSSEMIVWGGCSGNPSCTNVLNTGQRYNPSTNSWTATSTTNAPAARAGHTGAWTGSEMIVWGGFNGMIDVSSGGRYDPTTDTWTATSTISTVDARELHTAVWTGSEMIVWGGVNNGAILNTGGRYSPSTDSWIATSVTNAPDARGFQTAVWTGNEMIVWGGESGTEYFNTGGRYCAQSGSTHPAFFSGEVSLGNGVYYLQFPNGTPFGYYSYLTDQNFIYHFDMGFEYLFNANDGQSGIYFYDFMSNHFFYTSPSFPFPYLYDFSLNSVLYYYPDTNNPGHYTTNPRYFYNFATGQIITM